MRKLKIVIVENDEDEVFFMQEGFLSSGLFDIVAYAYNGDELFDMLGNPGRDLPDLIISDLNMPGKNGLDILEGMQQDPALARIPVIITSTSATESVVEKCKELGAHSYLIKPITFNEYNEFAKGIYRDFTNSSSVVGRDN